jgi:hypothetical protein
MHEECMSMSLNYSDSQEFARISTFFLEQLPQFIEFFLLL